MLKHQETYVINGAPALFQAKLQNKMNRVLPMAEFTFKDAVITVVYDNLTNVNTSSAPLDRPVEYKNGAWRWKKD